MYQIERAVQDRKVKKNGFNKKTPKKNNMIFYLSVIKLIHYEIPTGEKKNTKKMSKLKLLKIVVREFCFGLCNGTTRKIVLFPLFSPFCSKNRCPSPPLVFVVCLAVVHLDWASCAAP